MGDVQHVVRGIGINRELSSRLLYAIAHGAADVAGACNVAAGLGAGAPRPHPFLRYDASLLNARAFLEGAVLTRRRARERFEEGLRDGEELLRRDAEDTLFVA